MTVSQILLLGTTLKNSFAVYEELRREIVHANCFPLMFHRKAFFLVTCAS